MKIIRTVIASILAAASFAAVSCEKTPEEIVYLEVNANNISGQWQLVEWNGGSLSDGTYVYLDIVRNDKTYTMYQNIDSFNDIPHVVTGSFFLQGEGVTFGEGDESVSTQCTVIRGNYDHDSGDWAHRYIVKDLTADQMYWVAKDDPAFVQKFIRVESIPVE